MPSHKMERHIHSSFTYRSRLWGLAREEHLLISESCYCDFSFSVFAVLDKRIYYNL